MFTALQQDALRAYSGDDYRLINGWLRGDEPDSPRIRKMVAYLDSACLRAPLVDVAIVYRGIDAGTSALLRSAGVEAGSIVAERAFLSVSRTELTARVFSAWPPGGLIMRLRVGPSTRGIPLAPFSDFPDEQEILLSRNSRILITDVDYDNGSMDAGIL